MKFGEGGRMAAGGLVGKGGCRGGLWGGRGTLLTVQVAWAHGEHARASIDESA
jgi:hypothetical protein